MVGFKSCSFCANNNIKTEVLKIPKLLKKDTWMQDKDFYICLEHFEDQSDVITFGKRKRLRSDIGFPLTEEDLLDEDEDDINELVDGDEQENSLPVSDLALSDLGTDIGDNIEILTQSETHFEENSELGTEQKSASQSLYSQETGVDSASPVGHSVPSQQGSEWNPDNAEPSQSQTSERSSVMDEETPAGLSYHIVGESELRQLLSTCSECSGPVEDITLSRRGALTTATMVCLSHSHTTVWQSSAVYPTQSPRGPARSLLNTHISANILLEGLHFAPTEAFFKAVGMPFISRTLYDYNKETFVFPAVWAQWQACRKDAFQETLDRQAAGHQVTLASDANFDSPGYTAKYGITIMQDTETEKIVDMIVVEKHQVASSTAMEPTGCKTLLGHMESQGLDLSALSLSTDDSPSIRGLLNREYPMIKRQLDLWHTAKGVSKRVVKAAKRRGCGLLTSWHSSVNRQFYWAISTSKGNPRLAEQKLRGMFLHIQGKHEFGEGFDLFPRCDHKEDLPDRDFKPYLRPDSVAAAALEEAVSGHHNKVFKNLVFLDQAIHTSGCESAFAVMKLKYANKMISYCPLDMWMRTALGCNDVNHSVGRPQAVGSDGRPRTRVKVDRTGKKFSIQPVKVAKDYSWKKDILDNIDYCCEEGVVMDITLPTKDKPMRHNWPESKEQMEAAHTSRFEKAKVTGEEKDEC